MSFESREQQLEYSSQLQEQAEQLLKRHSELAHDMSELSRFFRDFRFDRLPVEDANHLIQHWQQVMNDLGSMYEANAQAIGELQGKTGKYSALAGEAAQDAKHNRSLVEAGEGEVTEETVKPNLNEMRQELDNSAEFQDSERRNAERLARVVDSTVQDVDKVVQEAFSDE